MDKPNTFEIKMSDEMSERLSKVMKRSGCADITDLLKRSLTLFDVCTAAQADGGEILIIDKQGLRTLVDVIAE